MSIIRTALLMGFLTGILLVVGYLLAGFSGMTVFLFMAFVMNFGIYWFSDRIVLAMYGAKELPKSKHQKIHEIVEKLSHEYKLTKPKLYIVEMPILNAFATGRNSKHSAVAVTRGLINNLDNDEIEGVLAHELGHIKNRDMLTATIAATVAGAIAYISNIAWWGLFGGNRREGSGNLILIPLLVLAPLAATLIQLAISRTREYSADKTGALISRKPLALASALEKISHVARHHPISGNSATAHLFIENPFKAVGIVSLFMTHPPVNERIKRLKEISKEL